MTGCDERVYAGLHPIECGVQSAGAAVSKGALEKMLDSSVEAATQSMNYMLSVWMRIPTPNFLRGVAYGDLPPQGTDPSSSLIPAVQNVWGALVYVEGVMVFLSICAIVLRTVQQNRAGELVNVGVVLLKLITVTSFGLLAAWVLIGASDEYAPWIMKVSAAGSDVGTESLVRAAALTQLGLIGGSLMSLLLLLGSVMQILFMIFRGAMLVVLIAVWPVSAAASGTEAGQQMFKKINMWMIALILYKPVAATIYAVGTALMFGQQQAPATSAAGVPANFASSLFEVVLGLTLITLSGLALPALVKALVPPAGLGVSSAFSGGEAVGALATGAVAVASFGLGAGAVGAGAGAGAGALGGGGGVVGLASAPSGAAQVPAATSSTPSMSGSVVQGGGIPAGSSPGGTDVAGSSGVSANGSGSSGSSGLGASAGQPGPTAGQAAPTSVPGASVASGSASSGSDGPELNTSRSGPSGGGRPGAGGAASLAGQMGSGATRSVDEGGLSGAEGAQ